MGSQDSPKKPWKLNVSLLYTTPVVGCEINPNVIVFPPERSIKSDYHVQYTWYRLEPDAKAICCMHPSEIATFQCLSCVTLNIPVRESYHCSAKCFYNAWKNHRARHCKAAATMCKTPNFDDLEPGEHRSCGSWPSPSYWYEFESALLLDRITTTVDGQGVSWRKVCSSRSYVPIDDDFSCRLRLESVVVDSKEGNPLTRKDIIMTDHVIFPPTPHPRCMIQFESLQGSWDFNLEGQSSFNGAFSVLSYNILADLYANRQIYSYCPTWALTWEYRRRNLLREILGYEADIICLQEVQSDHFENFFEPELVSRGYSVIYKKKKSEMFTSGNYAIDGCATFFRQDRFREVKKYELNYSEIAQKVANLLQPSEKQDEARIRLTKDNVALAVILEPMENGIVSSNSDCRFCVANTHITSNLELPDVKLLQTATLINGLEKIAAVQIPILICGDLNSLPSSAPHNLLVNGTVNPDQKGMDVDPIGIYQYLKLFHKLPLVSAYSSFLKVSGDLVSRQRRIMVESTLEPKFTNYTGTFSGTIDYIFYTADRFEVKGLLELLDVESARKHKAFPSPEWSSDHMALMAKFQLKPKSRYTPPCPLPLSIW